MSKKTKDSIDGQSKEGLDSPRKVLYKSEPADKPYIAFEQIKSLEDVIGLLHAEAGFAAKALLAVIHKRQLDYLKT